MISLPITITRRGSRKHIVEVNAERLERVAEFFGLISKETMASINRAEHDIRTDRIKRLKSFKDLRT